MRILSRSHRHEARGTGMFNPGEVVWIDDDQGFAMTAPACACFMMYEAFRPDLALTPARHRHNQAAVELGIALAQRHGFAQADALLALLRQGAPDVRRLRGLSDQMLTHISAEAFMECVVVAARKEVQA